MTETSIHNVNKVETRIKKIENIGKENKTSYCREIKADGSRFKIFSEEREALEFDE